MKKIAIYPDSINIESGGGVTYLIALVRSLASTHHIFLVVSSEEQCKSVPVEALSYCSVRIVDNQFFKIRIIGQFLHAIYDYIYFDIILFKANYIPRFAFISQSYLLVDFPFDSNPGWIQKTRLKTIRTILCNSLYTKDWIKQWWKREAEVLYPPADMAMKPLAKESIIISVGRFIQNGRSKRQDVLIQAFKALCDGGILNYALYLVGFVGDKPYYEHLVNMAKGYPIHFFTDISVDTLQELYGKSQFYWHACGYESDYLVNPSAVEHYGISVVDALSAGCLTLVYGVGGPREIVKESKNGFRWHSIDELVTKTKYLIEHPLIQEQMQGNAVRSSKAYSFPMFEKKVQGLF